MKPLPPLPPKGERAWTLAACLRAGGETLICAGAVLILLSGGRELGAYVAAVGLAVALAGLGLRVWDGLRREARGAGNGGRNGGG